HCSARHDSDRHCNDDWFYLSWNAVACRQQCVWSDCGELVQPGNIAVGGLRSRGRDLLAVAVDYLPEPNSILEISSRGSRGEPRISLPETFCAIRGIRGCYL